MTRTVALALVLTAAAAVPLRAAPTPQTQPSELQGAQQVLDRRVAALTSGDRAGWLATVDPRAPAAFRDAQGRIFDGWRSVPLASYSLKARTDDTGDLGHGLSTHYGGAAVYLPETRQSYRLAGYDDRDAVDSLWLTFVERDGRWYVGGDDDLSPLGLDTARQLWELGPVRVKPTPHFLVISHPAQATRADVLAGLAEEAIGVQIQRWARPWSQRIPLILPGSVDELAVLLQSTFDLNNFVAFVYYNTVRDDGYVATAPRIFIQDRNLARYPRPFQVETLVHELTHAATVPDVGPFVPSWVHEGTADWVAKGEHTDERAPAASHELPRDYQFSTGGGASIVRAYSQARSAMSWLSSARGRVAVGNLFAAVGSVKAAPGGVDYQVDQALRRVAGIDLATFQANWSGR